MNREKVNQNLLDEWQRKDKESLKAAGGFSLMSEMSKIKREEITEERKIKNLEVARQAKEESERAKIKLQVEFARFLSLRIYGYIHCPKWWHEMKYRNIMRG